MENFGLMLAIQLRPAAASAAARPGRRQPRLRAPPGHGPFKLGTPNFSQFGKDRRWGPGAREGLEEAGVFAGDAPCPGEERRRTTTRLYARQSMINCAYDVAQAVGAAQRALGASRRARGGWFTSAWRTLPALNQGT